MASAFLTAFSCPSIRLVHIREVEKEVMFSRHRDLVDEVWTCGLRRSNLVFLVRWASSVIVLLQSRTYEYFAKNPSRSRDVTFCFYYYFFIFNERKHTVSVFFVHISLFFRHVSSRLRHRWHEALCPSPGNTFPVSIHEHAVNLRRFH